MVRRRNEVLPAELTSAALALFGERGFAATRLEDVAARAGVSKGTVYLYFRSEEDLLKAVVRDKNVQPLDQGAALLAQYQGSSLELLRAMLECCWKSIGETELAGVPKLMVSEAGNFPELANFYNEQVIERGRQLLGGVLRRGIDSGEFRAMDVDAVCDLVIAPPLMRTIWRFSIGACCGGGIKHGAEENQRLLDKYVLFLASGLSIAEEC
jgi:AcrR family transcriptional regulator